ncbi:MAG TPA: sigma-70 family RNA polymerase sigma factor [Myxococcaceae bacterium]|nr:sigma-70 family RNA polymerase sigma factor [Myxococcaceae bacterium]
MSIAAAELEQHRPALTGHCYRMMGSAVDADDAVQETLVRAWRNLHRFDGRASLRTWLYRIATNVCLDMLASSSRRARSLESGPAGTADDPLEPLPRTHWLEPVPDLRAIPADADPAEAAVLRQSIRLAFVAALQHLPPKQRAVLILTEVLGWSAAEVADSLETSVASVNSALQRARATMASRDPVDASRGPLSEAQSKLVQGYVDAFLRYDVDALVALLHQDATLSMPPYRLWFQGREAIRAWLLGRGAHCRGSRMIPTAACGQPAFGQYIPGGPDGGYTPWALLVLDLSGDSISNWISFLDTQELFPRFGLPLSLPTDA